MRVRDDDTDVLEVFCFDMLLLLSTLFSSTFDNEDDDHDIKSCISRPTPSGRKRHHATHATELSSTVFVIVNAIPICIEHINPIAQYKALRALQKLLTNAIGTPNNSTYTTVGVSNRNPLGPNRPYRYLAINVCRT